MIKHNVIKKIFLLLAVASVPMSHPSDAFCGQKDYNVVLIVIDALRPDHLGCYGYSRNTSPHIDRLAKKGIFFKNAYAQGTYTIPSFASLFTSRYPVQHGVFNVKSKLEDSEMTMAEILRIFGYRTSAFTAGIFLNRRFNFDQGFEVYKDIAVDINVDYSMPRPPKRSFRSMKPEVIDWIDSVIDEKFFLFLHVMEVHPPLYLPKDGDDHVYDDSYEGMIDSLSIDLRLKNEVYCNMYYGKDGDPASISDKDLDHVKAHYDAANTAWAGPGVQHTLFSYASQVPYEEIIRIPLIIVHPEDSLRSKVINETVQQIDILPTVLDMIGRSPKEDAEGISLVPLIKGEKNTYKDRPVFSSGSSEGNIHVTLCTYSLIKGNIKLLVKPVNFAHSVIELYDLATDPHERENIVYKEKESAASMIKYFIAHFSDHQEFLEKTLNFYSVFFSSFEKPKNE